MEKELREKFEAIFSDICKQEHKGRPTTSSISTDGILQAMEQAYNLAKQEDGERIMAIINRNPSYSDAKIEIKRILNPLDGL